MKICPTCNQTYGDNEQNYCLNDGRILEKMTDDAPPTVYMDSPRITNQNWQSNAAPISPWEDQSKMQNQGFAYPPAVYSSKDQTLPIVSMVFGILSLLLLCCYGGIPLGLVALITGYIGMNNEKGNPERYGGRGMAIAGIVTGAIGLLLSIGMIFFVLIANL